MPYVVKHGDVYLLRHANNHLPKRELVAELNRATTWSEIGHAKNAIREAVQDNIIPSDTRILIMRVDYREQQIGTAVKYKLDRYGTARSMDVA